MKAVTITAFDTPPALLEDLPAPTPAPNEVLVRVHGSSVNPVDNGIAAGMLKDRRRTAALPPEGTYQLADEAPDLTAALKTLPPKQRGAVVLRYYGGYSIKETAAILDSTPAAVGVHLTRGRRRLRTLLEERDA